MFGWSPARYVTGVPASSPSASAASAVSSPCTPNVGTLSASNPASIPSSSSRNPAGSCAWKSQKIPSLSPDTVVATSPVSFAAR